MDIKQNTTWNREISEKEVYERKFSEANLLFTNTHIPLIQELKDKILATYKVKAKFIHLGYNGESLYCNGQRLVYASSKFSRTIKLGENVTLLDGNLVPCGSNKYPRIGGKDSWCILEFISFGLPYVDTINGWQIQILEIQTI
jgi:hypothetical protein